MLNNPKKGIALLIIATLFWSGNYICGRYLAPALPPMLLNTIRWGVSALILWGLLRAKKQRLPLLAKWKEFGTLGFLGIFVFSTLTYEGLTQVSASRAGMISALIPMFILLSTPLILKEKVTWRAWLGSLISIAGVYLLFQSKTSDPSSGTLEGDVMIFLSCVAWSFYTVLGKKYGATTDPLTLTAGAAVYGSLFSAISSIGAIGSASIHITPTAWLCILYVSTFASVVAYFCWNAGVKLVGAAKAAPFINLLPIWTVLLGVVLLGEQISGIALAGGGLAMMGAIFASGRTNRQHKHGGETG
ncbi:DMT family transporter [Paenibacillus kribbensis]|uniref:DMT family transporter n=1 Tax=Paenibacillus kribbensis TaxID=172713 RepID=UPI000837DB47|nr:DMT family transporter [Paenibacillus kribbensis]